MANFNKCVLRSVPFFHANYCASSKFPKENKKYVPKASWQHIVKRIIINSRLSQFLRGIFYRSFSVSIEARAKRTHNNNNNKPILFVNYLSRGQLFWRLIRHQITSRHIILLLSSFFPLPNILQRLFTFHILISQIIAADTDVICSISIFFFSLAHNSQLAKW